MRSLQLLLLLLLLLLTVVVGANVAAVSTKCPFACQCYQQTSIYSIFCVDSGLTKIPNSFNFYVKIINFTNNRVPKLGGSSFRNPYFKSLEILDLRNNHIEVAEEKAFAKLKNLLELDLTGNQIRKLNRKLFANNKFLNTIRLRGNPLAEIKDYAFPPLIYLRHLDLQACKLKKIHHSAFFNTPQLERLNLKDNNLKSLSSNVLRLTQLKALSLDGNRWTCDQHLWRLLKGLHERNLQNDSMLCVYGETENAIFWDTMEADKPNKFKSDGGAVVARSKRNISADYGGGGGPKKAYRRKSRDMRMLRPPPPPLLENSPRMDDDEADDEDEDEETTDDEEIEDNANISPKSGHFPPLFFNGGDIRNPPAGSQGGQQIYRHQTAENVFRKTLPSSNFDDLMLAKGKFSYFNQTTGNGGELLELNVEDVGDHSKEGFSPSIMLTSLFKGETDFEGTTDTAGFPKIRADSTKTDNSSSVDEDRMDFKILTFLIVIEFILLPVLLYILFRIWKMNRYNAECGANAPLNNKEKKITNYDTQTPGYKRILVVNSIHPLGFTRIHWL